MPYDNKKPTKKTTFYKGVQKPANPQKRVAKKRGSK